MTLPLPPENWNIERINDERAEEIAAFLRTDRRYAAYALGDLDGPNRARVAWGMAYDEAGRPTAQSSRGLAACGTCCCTRSDSCRR